MLAVGVAGGPTLSTTTASTTPSPVRRSAGPTFLLSLIRLSRAPIALLTLPWKALTWGKPNSENYTG
jgi:hypothetical protein